MLGFHLNGYDGHLQATIKFQSSQQIPKSIAGWSHLYIYTADLLCLQFCRPHTPHYSQALSTISTSLNPLAWSKALLSHPDRAFANYVCEGLCAGFCVGFQHGSPLRSASSNMPSALLHPKVVNQYLEQELAKGRMFGHFPSPPLHINRFGVIPKGHNTGKWRLIYGSLLPQRSKCK